VASGVIFLRIGAIRSGWTSVKKELEFARDMLAFDKSAARMDGVKGPLTDKRQDVVGALVEELDPHDFISGVFSVDKEIKDKKRMSADEFKILRESTIGHRLVHFLRTPWKVCYLHSKSQNQIVLKDSLNASLPLVRRIRFLKQWLASPSVDSSSVMQGINSLIDRAENETAEGALNPETSAFISTIIPAALRSAMDPWMITSLLFTKEILEKDRANVVGTALLHARKVLNQHQQVSLFQQILHTERRPEYLKVSIHKTIIDCLKDLGCDASIQILFDEMPRIRHMDVKDKLRQCCVSLLSHESRYLKLSQKAVNQVYELLERDAGDVMQALVVLNSIPCGFPNSGFPVVPCTFHICNSRYRSMKSDTNNERREEVLARRTPIEISESHEDTFYKRLIEPWLIKIHGYQETLHILLPLLSVHWFSKIERKFQVFNGFIENCCLSKTSISYKQVNLLTLLSTLITVSAFLDVAERTLLKTEIEKWIENMLTSDLRNVHAIELNQYRLLVHICVSRNLDWIETDTLANSLKIVDMNSTTKKKLVNKFKYEMIECLITPVLDPISNYYTDELKEEIKF